MSCCLRPRNGLILLQFDKQEESKTAQGIIIPASRSRQGEPTSRFEEATIVAKGRGIFDYGQFVNTDDLNVGDRVIVKSGVHLQLGVSQDNYFGVEVDGQKMGIVNQSDIIAVIVPAS